MKNLNTGKIFRLASGEARWYNLREGRLPA
jgi:hypothetical protein